MSALKQNFPPILRRSAGASRCVTATAPPPPGAGGAAGLGRVARLRAGHGFLVRGGRPPRVGLGESDGGEALRPGPEARDSESRGPRGLGGLGSGAWCRAVSARARAGSGPATPSLATRALRTPRASATAGGGGGRGPGAGGGVGRGPRRGRCHGTALLVLGAASASALLARRRPSPTPFPPDQRRGRVMSEAVCVRPV